MKKTILTAVVLYKKISAVFRDLRLPVFIYTDCKFYPTCSDYAVEAISKYGAARGSVKSLLRILRCSPASKGGVDFP